ncbi:hypothetical protein OG272_16165 [Streptomyces sp. NBC_00104]
MISFRHFMLGLAYGTVAGALAVTIPVLCQWWWVVALLVTVLVWALHTHP